MAGSTGPGCSSTGGKSVHSQLRTLNAQFGDDDSLLCFKENSVRDVSDRGREQGAATLRAALERGVASLHAKRQRALTCSDRPEEPSQAETDLQCDVRSLLNPLKVLRQERTRPRQQAEALDLMRRLQHMAPRITVATLKATKVAAEINEKCWREAPGDLGRISVKLVRDWRSLYHTQTSLGIAPRSLPRRLHNTSMDLEASIFSEHQAEKSYRDTVSHVEQLILGEVTLCRDLLNSKVRPEDVAKRRRVMRE